MKKYSLFLFSMLMLGFTSCSDDDDNGINPNEETANVSVKLTDAPGDYDKVEVEVEDVQIKMITDDESASEDSWQSLQDIHTGVYDLLTLTAGNTQLLADAELPTGKITEMRLVLGGENSVTVDGVDYSLQAPSDEQSGLSLNVNQDLKAGETYTFLLDFDVENSIVKESDGNYLLKPVLRVSVEEETGAIIGSVHPTDHQALIVASNGTTPASTYSNSEGKFKLNGLPEGTYQVTITPDPEMEVVEVIQNNVKVKKGETTDLEVVFLE